MSGTVKLDGERTHFNPAEEALPGNEVLLEDEGVVDAEKWRVELGQRDGRLEHHRVAIGRGRPIEGSTERTLDSVTQLLGTAKKTFNETKRWKIQLACRSMENERMGCEKNLHGRSKPLVDELRGEGHLARLEREGGDGVERGGAAEDVELNGLKGGDVQAS